MIRGISSGGTARRKVPHQSSQQQQHRPTSKATSTGSSSSSSAAPTRRYSVLYYKRTKKVHKSKGVTKSDGILTVMAPPSCLVTLVDADAGDDEESEDDEDSDDDDGGRWGKKKKRKTTMKKKLSKKKSSQKLSSGINWAVSKRAFGLAGDAEFSGGAVSNTKQHELELGENTLQEDDVVVLPQFECQIVEVLGASSSSQTSALVKKGPTPPAAGRSGGGVIVRKRPLVPLASRRPSVSAAAATVAKPPPQDPPPPRRVPPVQPSKSGPVRRNNGVGGVVRRVPPAQPSSKPTPTSGGNGILAGRIPPKQPGQNQRRHPSTTGPMMNRTFKPIRSSDEEESESDSSDNGSENRAPNIVRPNPVRPGCGALKRVGGSVRGSNAGIASSSSSSSSLLGGKRKRIISTGVKRTVSPKSTNPSSSSTQGNNPFPGSIGTLTAPSSIRSILRPHQVEGVTFLWNCLTGASPPLRKVAEQSGAGEKAARGVVLADEMGLGKTLMTITTIYALHRRQRDHRFIVVCPSSLVSNWAKEFDKWLGKASQPKRVVIRRGGEDGLKAIRAFVPVKPQKPEVLIVSYELFRMNVSILSQSKQIGLLVVDEGHRLKNTSGSLTLSALNSLKCESRLLITGTPIQNNLSEFYNVVNFVCPGILGDLASFRREYERPISAANNKRATREQKEKGRAQSRALDGITSTFMLRRLQKDVLKSLLPPRTEILVFCRPSDRQCQLYKQITAGGRFSPTPNSGGSADALTLLTKVRKLCSHPYLLRDTTNDDSYRKDDDVSEDDEIVSLSRKLSVLESFLVSVRRCNPTDKVVIVSNFTSALTVIQNAVLRPRKWPSIRLDGTTEQNARQSLVDSFNRGTVEQSFVFLLSSKAGGCGLNLIGANRLVMFDADWNPATDMQAMARIYRQGQTKPCYIYRLFTSGTVEEVVYQRQTQKGNLATLAVDGRGKKKGQSRGFTKEELRDCFTLKEGCPCDTKQKVGSEWDDYDGVTSLQTQGCCDEPLLTIAEERSDVVAFVHIVDKESSDDDPLDEGSEEEPELSSGNERSSSDEREFDGCSSDEEKLNESSSDEEQAFNESSSDEEQEFDG